LNLKSIIGYTDTETVKLDFDGTRARADDPLGLCAQTRAYCEIDGFSVFSVTITVVT